LSEAIFNFYASLKKNKKINKLINLGHDQTLRRNKKA
jgi:hypothetical protein